MEQTIANIGDAVSDYKPIGSAATNKEFRRYLMVRYGIKRDGEGGMFDIARTIKLDMDELDVLFTIKKACDIDERDKKWLTEAQLEDLATINYEEVRT